MATRKVKVGDKVSHEGNWVGAGHMDGEYVVTLLEAGGEDPDDPLRRLPDFFAHFENGRYAVTCLAADLEWFPEDDAWMLGGRLLTRDQRRAYCILTDQSVCSPKVHQSARYELLQNPEATVAAMDQAVAEREAAAAKAAEAGEVTDG